jgi:hypothetical protein
VQCAMQHEINMTSLLEVPISLEIKELIFKSPYALIKYTSKYTYLVSTGTSSPKYLFMCSVEKIR